MSFLAPIAFALLAALPIIIVLHLLRDRRPRVPVSSLALWRRFKRKTGGPRLRRLPLTWLLLAQLLLAACLALALAQPELSALAGRPTHTIILLDTSASMAASDVRPTRFAAASGQARQLVGGLRGGDTVTLVGMGPRAERLGSTGAGGRDALLARLNALAPGGVGADLAGAIALAGAAIDLSSRNRIVVLTDTAYPTSDLEHLPPALAPLEWRVVGSATANQAIIAFSAAELPNREFDVFARVAHYDGRPSVREIELLVDGQAVDRRALPFQPDSDISLSWSVPAGTGTVQLVLRGDDALPGDDQATLSLTAPPPQRVLLVAGTPAGGDALERALRALPGLVVTRIAPPAYRTQAADLTIFESTLPQAWPATGGVLVVSPALTPAGSVDEAGVPQRALLTLLGIDRVQDVQGNPGDPLLSGVDLAGVRFGNLAIVDPGNDLQIIALSSERPLILRGRRGSELPPLIVLAFDLGQSSLPGRVSFPLLMANAVAELTPPPLPAAIKAGESVGLGALDAAGVTVTLPDGSDRPVSGEAGPGVVLRDTLLPGLYTLSVTRSDGSVRSERFAVHAGSPRESDLRPRSLVSLSIQQQPAATRPPAPQALWPWLALVGLGVLGVEGWLHWLRR